MQTDALNTEIANHLRGTGTRLVSVEAGLLEQTGDRLRPFLPPGSWMLVADPVTWPLAGERSKPSLQRAAGATHLSIVAPRAPGRKPIAGEREVAAVGDAIRTTSATAIIGIGSGTVGDVAKLAAHRAGLPYAIICTAPSMNGYTSGIASMLVDGVKTSIPCTPPVACLVDVEIVQGAPQEMIAAGFGDLISRSVSTADWYLSHVLCGSEFDQTVCQTVDASGRLVDGIASLLPRRDPQALAHLSAALCISGVVMQASSAPVSGGEHLISHYIDMMAAAWGTEPDLHGCQVGVATLVSAALYERLLALGCAPFVSGPDLGPDEERIRAHFGALSTAMLGPSREIYGTPQQCAHRLSLLTDDWDEITSSLGNRLRGSQQIREDLNAAGCPVRFSDLGLTHQHAREAICFSRHIRDRHTILHLCSELGVLEEWSSEVVEQLEEWSVR